MSPEGVSYRELASKHNVPLGTLVHRARNEAWTARRESFRAQSAHRIREKIRELQAEEIAHDYELLQKATRKVEACIESDSILCKDLDSAIATLISLVKTKEVLGGGVSDRTEDASTSAGAANLDEMRERLSESIHVLSVVLDHESRRAGTK